MAPVGSWSSTSAHQGPHKREPQKRQSSNRQERSVGWQWICLVQRAAPCFWGSLNSGRRAATRRQRHTLVCFLIQVERAVKTDVRVGCKRSKQQHSI